MKLETVSKPIKRLFIAVIVVLASLGAVFGAIQVIQHVVTKAYGNGTIESITPNEGVSTGGQEITIEVDNLDLTAPVYEQDGLVAHYDGINNTRNGHSTSSTVWEDLSGNGNDVSLVGTLGASDWQQNGFLFTGAKYFKADAATLANLPFGAGANTNEVNYQVEETLSDEAVLFVYGDDSGYTTTQGIQIDNNMFGAGAFYYASGSNFAYWTSPDGRTEGTRRTLTARWNGTEVSGYNDGVFGASTSFTGRNTLEGPLYIGINSDLLPYYAAEKMIIRSVRIYDRALTEQEIACNAAIDRFRFDGSATEDFENCMGEIEVKIGDKICTNATVVDSTHVSCTTPAGSLGTADVTVSYGGETATLTNGYTYLLPLPTITSITPDIGSTSGNTEVTITGTNFMYEQETRIVQVAAGGYHTLALDSNGDVWAWGQNQYGQLGNTTNNGSNIADNPTPTKVIADAKFVQVAAGFYHTLALDSNGDVWAWGHNQFGQLGNATNNGSSSAANPTPTKVSVSAKFSQIAAGFYHTLALDSNGDVWAWGQNRNGQLGNSINTGSSTANPTPAKITAGAQFSQIAASGYHSLAISVSSDIWAWGQNQYGQLGNATNNGSSSAANPTPTKVSASAKFSQIAGGYYHSLAVDVSGNTWTWGMNMYGQLGNSIDTSGTAANPTPTKINSSARTIGIAGGYYFTAMLDINGDVWAAGRNDYGQLGTETNSGNGNSTVNSTPIKADLDLLPINVDIIDSVTFGSAVCTNLMILSATRATCSAPPHDYGAVDVTINSFDGQTATLANGYTYKLPTPTITGIDPDIGPIVGGTEVTITGTNFLYEERAEIVQVAAGAYHSLALDVDGNVYVWGRDNYGQVGDGTSTTNHSADNVIAPVKLNGLDPGTGYTNPITDSTKIVQIAAKSNHSMALDSDGNIYAWGLDDNGQIGDGALTDNHSGDNVLAPVKLNGLDTGSTYTNPITADTKIVRLAVGSLHSLAVDDSGNVYLWGQDTYGQVGDGALTANHYNTTSVLAPIKLNGLDTGSTYTNPITAATEIVEIAGGLSHSMATDKDGNLYIWGRDNYGQVGDGTSTTNRSGDSVLAPKILNGLAPGGSYTNPISSSTMIDKIAAGNSHSLVTDDQGNLYAWGYDSNGQVGDGTVTANHSSTMVLAPVLLNGLDPGVGYTNPITSLTPIANISAAGSHSLAVDNAGKVYSWGGDDYGQIGDGALTSNHSGDNVLAPIMISGLDPGAGYTNYISDSTGIVEVSAGFIHSMALDDAGQVYTWGADLYGQTGDGGSTINHASNNVIVPINLSTIDTSPYQNALGVKYNPVALTVTFGGEACTSLEVISDTEMKCLTPEHVAGEVDVAITTLDNQTATTEDAFEYIAPPTVTGVSPSTGLVSGGTTVTITGTGLNHVISVDFGGSACENITNATATQLTCTTTAHTYGTVNVTATNSLGDSGTLPGGYTYKLPLPTITSITPDKGPTAGGTEVTITGENFAHFDNYSQDGLVAHYDGINNTRNGHDPNATTWEDLSGNGNDLGTIGAAVDSSNWQQNGFLFTGQYFYRQYADTENIPFDTARYTLETSYYINSTIPSSLNPYLISYGGTSNNNMNALAIYSSQDVASNVWWNNSLAWSVQDIGVAGTKHTLSTSWNGNTQYGYTDGVLVAQKANTAKNTTSSPFNLGVRSTDADINSYATGVILKSARVYDRVLSDQEIACNASLDQYRFDGVINADYYDCFKDMTIQEIKIGDSECINPKLIDGNHISCTTSANSAGLVDVVVTTIDNQTITESDGFEYIAPPTITDISPDSGLISGGTEVTITGTGMDYVTSVMFGDIECADVDIVDDTELTCTTLPYIYGAVDVKLTNVLGNSATSLGGFTYKLPLPTITSVTPDKGSTNGQTEVTITGTNLQTYRRFSQVSIGTAAEHTLAIDLEGNLWGWGLNDHTQAVNSGITETPQPLAAQIKPGTKFKQVHGGRYHSLALTRDGKLWGWGYNGTSAVLGTSDTTTPQSTAVNVLSDKTFKQISTGDRTSYAIDTEDKLWAWGYNLYGQANGNGTTGSTGQPVNQVKPGTTFKKVSGGTQYAIAIDSSGIVWGWGGNTFAQVSGTGSTSTGSYPTATRMLSSSVVYADISAGAYHAMALDENGRLFAWGSNNLGQVGSGSASELLGSTQVKSGTTFSKIAAGHQHSLAIDSNGNLWGWGYNGHGQASGDASTGETHRTPVQIMPGTTFIDITAGENHSLAMDSSGNLWGFGDNSYGQITGTGEITPSVSPAALVKQGISSVSTVKFDGLTCTSLEVISDTEMKCLTPAHVEGEVDVAITTLDNQTVTETDGYLYVPPVTITAINPNEDFNVGGETVTLTGSGFTYLTSVTIGGELCTNLTILSDTSATCIVPAHANGVVDVVVTSVINETSTLTNGFTYKEPWYISLTLDENTLAVNATPGNPSSIATDSVVATVDTNWTTGYTLSVEKEENTGIDLVCSTSSSNIIPATSTDGAMIDLNSYGIGRGASASVDPTSWVGVSATPKLLHSTAVPGLVNNYVYLGVRTDLTKPACNSYNGAITLTAVMNP